MNRQDSRSTHYSQLGAARTSQRPFAMILRDVFARLVLGDLRGGTA